MLRYTNRIYSEYKQKKEFNYNINLNNRVHKAIECIKNKSCIDRIFVVGNGPSLNKQNLDLLKNEFTICSNGFYLMYDKINWRPTVMTIEDSLIVDDNLEYFNSNDNIWKFVPYDLISKIKNNDRTVHLNFLRSYRHWSRKKWPYFSNDIRSVSYWGGTVSFLSLQIAATFNPKIIYLIGTDLSYVVPKNIIKKGTMLISKEDDKNHFSPQYFGKGKKWHIPEVDRMQHSFKTAYEILTKMDIKLVNATEGGNLKHIPRIPFESIFQ